MAFRVRQQSRPNTIGCDPTIWILEDDDGACLEVWPARGFNAYRWRVGGEEILYCDAAFFDGSKPTRSGWPILFPFPNRIRAGRFAWNGVAYQWPLNDPSGTNAIHGFVVGRPWRIIDHGADATQAWVTASFEVSCDAPEMTSQWPGASVLQLTYRLAANSLRVEATVANVGTTPLPFGLGFHPYFRVAPFGGDQACIDIAAGKQWQLNDCLPTGSTVNFGWQQQRFATTQLDDLFTDVPMCRADARHSGAMESDEGRRLVVEASRDFGQVVVFTPPHRQAICFEPYTCTTDAINLQQQGIDAGLIVLPPAERWHGWVQVEIVQDPTSAA